MKKRNAALAIVAAIAIIPNIQGLFQQNERWIAGDPPDASYMNPGAAPGIAVAIQQPIDPKQKYVNLEKKLITAMPIATFCYRGGFKRMIKPTTEEEKQAQQAKEAKIQEEIKEHLKKHPELFEYLVDKLVPAMEKLSTHQAVRIGLNEEGWLQRQCFKRQEYSKKVNNLKNAIAILLEEYPDLKEKRPDLQKKIDTQQQKDKEKLRKS